MINIGVLQAVFKLKDEMSAKLKTLQAKLKTTVDRVKQNSTAFQKLGGVLKSNAAKFIGVGSAIGVAVIAVTKLTQAFKASISRNIEFEESMTRIQTLVGVSAEAVAGMTDKVRELSKSSGRGITELAEGLFQITSAGLRGEAAMSVLNEASKAARVGLGDVATIADIATSAMNAYGAANISAEEAVGVLLKTVREGKASPEELAASLGRIIPIAATMGVAFSEVSGIVASMTRIGFSSSEAVTSLRQGMVAILKPTTQAEDALEQVGLSIEDVRSTLKEDGLLIALQELREAMTLDQFARFIGSTEALAGILGVTGDRFKETAAIVESTGDSFGELDDAIKIVEETAADRAARFSAAWGGAIDSVTEKFIRFSLATADSMQENTAEWGALVVAMLSANPAGQLVLGTFAALGAVMDKFGDDTEAAGLSMEELAKQSKELAALGLTPLVESQEDANRAMEEARELAASVADAIKDKAEAEERAVESAQSLSAVMAPLLGMQKDIAANYHEVAVEAQMATISQFALTEAMEDFRQEAILISDVAFKSGIGDASFIGPEILASAAKGIGDIEGLTEDVTFATLDWGSSVRDLDALFGVLGITAESSLGSMLSSVSFLTDSMSVLSKESQAVFENMSGLEKAQAGAGAAIQGIGAVAQATSSGSTRARIGKGALAGAGAGMKIGGMFGPLGAGIGAAVGAAAGAITGWIRGKSFASAMDTVKREFGFTISEGLMDGIRKSGKPASLATAAIFEEGIANGTATVDDLARKMGDIFSEIQSGNITTPEGITALQDAIPLLIANFEDLGPAGEEQIQRILGAAKEMGIEFEGLTELITTTLTDEALEAMGLAGVTNVQAIRDAALELGIGFDVLKDKILGTFAPQSLEEMMKTLGLTNSEARALAETLGVDLATNLELAALGANLTVAEFKALQEAAGGVLGKDGAASMEELAALMEATGLSALELAERLDVDVAGSAGGLKEEIDKGKAGIDAAEEAARALEAALAAAAAAAGRIHIPSAGGSIPEFAHGGFVPETFPSGQIVRVAEPGTGGEDLTPRRGRGSSGGGGGGTDPRMEQLADYIGGGGLAKDLARAVRDQVAQSGRR